jgi:hypothetical protein
MSRDWGFTCHVSVTPVTGDFNATSGEELIHCCYPIRSIYEAIVVQKVILQLRRAN